MLKVKKLHPDAYIPTVAYPGEDLGYDIYALNDTVLIQDQPTLIKTGLIVAYIGQGNHYGLVVKDRSSMALKGITTSGGVIDAGYRGELGVILTDRMSRATPYVVKSGDKIAQMIPTLVRTYDTIELVDELPESGREHKGFGSSGQ